MLKCLLVCPGVGHVRRGYESFSLECAAALQGRSDLELILVKGAGKAGPEERTVCSLRREWFVTRLLSAVSRRDPYYLEQLTFMPGLLRLIRREDPDVIYFSDSAIGNALWRIRKKRAGRYKLLFSNGGPMGPPFPRWDHTQQVSAAHYQTALKAGEPADKMTLLPYGFALPSVTLPLTDDAKAVLRRRLDLPTDRPIVLAAGALNSTHKRMDYVIREIASIPAADRPFLLLLGQADKETSALQTLAADRLQPGDYRMQTAPASQMPDFYATADVFVLASMSEGFGRVFVEAAAQGLACVAHDYPVTRDVLGEFGYFRDLSVTGSLTRAIGGLTANPMSPAARQNQMQAIYDRYSWNQLAPAYVQMIGTVAEAL